MPSSVSVSHPVEASGLLEGERPANRMHFRSNADDSHSNSLHPERSVRIYILRLMEF
jgi:hypothetical protein